MYKVIKGFHDLQDCVETKAGVIPHWYEPGDIYPRTGAKTTDARTEELASPHNAQGAPLIEFVEGAAPEEEAPVEEPVPEEEAPVEEPAPKTSAKKPTAKKTTGK